MSWNKVGYDDGRSGLEWKWKLNNGLLTVFINGSDHVDDYRHRGDLVPLLMFWLARFQMKKIGSWTWPWKAHGPDTYHTQMAADGFR